MAKCARLVFALLSSGTGAFRVCRARRWQHFRQPVGGLACATSIWQPRTGRWRQRQKPIRYPAFIGGHYYWTVLASYVILRVISLVIGLHVDQQSEIECLDLSQHGKRGYHSN